MEQMLSALRWEVTATGNGTHSVSNHAKAVTMNIIKVWGLGFLSCCVCTMCVCLWVCARAGMYICMYMLGCGCVREYVSIYYAYCVKSVMVSPRALRIQALDSAESLVHMSICLLTHMRISFERCAYISLCH